MSAARVLAAAALMLAALPLAAAKEPPAAPPFPAGQDRWIGAPQSWPGLEGKVVLMEVWTFG